MAQTDRIIDGPRKLFLSMRDAQTGEWGDPIEIAETSPVTLGPIEDEDAGTGHRFTATLKMTARIKPLPRKKWIRLLQYAGMMRRPRCTYKTNKDYINRLRFNGRKRPKH